jgi:hypothetical protein
MVLAGDVEPGDKVTVEEIEGELRFDASEARRPPSGRRSRSRHRSRPS